MWKTASRKMILLGSMSILVGCVGMTSKPEYTEPYTYNPEHSRALNFMFAAGTMVENGEILDVQIERPEGAGETALDYSSSRQNADHVFDALQVYDGVSVMAGFTPPPLGVSVGFHGAMSLLSLFNTPYKPSFLRSHYVAYMPESLATSPEEAQARMENMIKKASIKSLPEGATVLELTNTWTSLFGKQEREVTVVQGGGCNQSFVMFYGDKPGPSGCKLWTEVKSQPSVAIAPEWLGGQKSYFFHPDFYKKKGTDEGLIIAALMIDDQPNMGWSSGDRLAEIRSGMGEYAYTPFSLRLSENMPEWFFVYIAPTKIDPIPKIFHQGKVYYFAKYAP